MTGSVQHGHPNDNNLMPQKNKIKRAGTYLNAFSTAIEASIENPNSRTSENRNALILGNQKYQPNMQLNKQSDTAE